MNYLTALRGLAALLVVLFHIKQYLVQIAGMGNLYPLYADGYLAVDFFFVLSGFIISYKYHDYFTNRIRGRFYEFICKRIARIYPLHLFLLACYAAIPLALLATGRPVDSKQFGVMPLAFKTLLVDLWTFDGVSWKSWNVPSWSISGEFFAYLVFPFLIYFMHSVSAYIRVGVIAAGVAALIYAYNQPTCSSLGACIGTLGLLRCMVEFSLGTGVFLLHRKTAGTPSWRYAVVALGATALLAVLIAFRVPNYFYVSILFAAILYGMLGSHGPVHQLLETTPLVYLGDISYSIYLAHVFVAEILFKLFLENGEVPGVALIASYIAATLTFSAFTYHMVEVPLRRRVYDLLARPRPGNAAEVLAKNWP